MLTVDGHWHYSPQDVLAQLECDHRARLDHAAAHQLIARPASAPDATLDLIAQHGLTHEQSALEAMKSLVGGDLVEMGPPPSNTDELLAAAAETRAALDAGVGAVYQAVLLVDGFLGYADFVTSVHPATGEVMLDGDGRRRYEPVDAKLARSAKPGALLQAACYADALVRLGHPEPRQVHLWLGDSTVESAPATDLLPLAAEYRERVQGRLDSQPVLPEPTWGDARTACSTCRWSSHCDTGRRDARDLSLVAGIRGDQVRKLRHRGVATVEQLAAAGAAHRPTGMGTETFERLRAQAGLQSSASESARLEFDVFDPAALDALPAPDAGDLYYDIEGDPFAESGEGLEYLHGVVDADEGFRAEWGDDRAGEKAAFEAIVDRITAAAAEHPGMHVYHYASYEKTALTHLAARHGTREAEVDQLLRDGRLVDLFTVVRRSVRVSAESYSIKKLEPLYMGEQMRTSETTDGGASIVQYELARDAVATGDHETAARLRRDIEDYNRYDCVSTLRLHRWLLTHRTTAPTAAVVVEGVDAPAPAPPVDAELIAQLSCALPASERTTTQHTRALLGAALSYYAREHKPFWWAHFDRLTRPLEDLVEDDDAVVLDRVGATEWAVPARSRVLKRTVTALTTSTAADVGALGKTPFVIYDAPHPAHLATSVGSTRGTHTSVADVDGTVCFVESAGTGRAGWHELPAALTPGAPPRSTGQQEVLRSLAHTLLADEEPDAAWYRLLARQVPSASLPRTGDDPTDITAALVSAGRDVLAVQGPPGTGKTYVGSRVIAALAARGWRIGVAGQSHKVIEHLLGCVVAVDPSLRVAKEPHTFVGPWERPKELGKWMGDEAGGFVVGGTSWTFAKKGVRAVPLDLLVIDEAGQFSLTDALVTGSAADRMLLLGDPQQLPQVTTGTHAEPIDVSALGHLLGDHALVSEAQGYLLATTWRMHPAVCAPVSRLQYEGVLVAHERCSSRRLAGVDPGVHLVEVAHTDNRTSSPEETAAIVNLARSMVGTPWTDHEGVTRPLTAADVLVVAPFNRQVTDLKVQLGRAGLADAQVGTVDKFQGREAPVVIVSMTTSSGEDLPRGLEFLLSRNRLNVAISRAMWAAYLVHSPALRRITPTSPAALVALGAFVGLLRQRPRQ